MHGMLYLFQVCNQFRHCNMSYVKMRDLAATKRVTNLNQKKMNDYFTATASNVQ